MKLHLLSVPLTLVLAAVLSTTAFAQDEDRPNRRGGFGGQGRGIGPGAGGGDPILGLLMSEKVREEIKLLPDQEAALTKVREQAMGNNERPDFDFRSATDAERQQFFEKMQQQRRETAKQVREKVEEVLGPDQLERLEQISLQVRGTAALSDPEVAGKLNVTPDQKTKLESIRTEGESAMRDRMRNLFQSGDREKIREEFQKAREEMDEKTLAVLTDDQRKQFDEMKGEKFELPEGELGRGGFGGRGPGAGGPGAGGPGFGGRRGGDRGGDDGDRPRRRQNAD